jgi:IclR family acetate operon transcriptional repressor
MARIQKEYSVPALEKSIAILNALSESELSISEINSELNLPKSTIFVILNTMEKHSLIEKTPEGKYKLGSGMFRWCISYIQSIDLTRIARPHLERPVKETPYTAHLAVLANRRAVYINKVEGNGFVRFATAIGQSMALYSSGVGKALCIGLDDEEIKLAISMEIQPEKPRPFEAVMEDIHFAREHGFSIEDEEYEDGIRCVGAPIYNFTGKIVAAISITSISKDLPAVRFFTVGEQVKQAANQISSELGYNPKIG